MCVCVCVCVCCVCVCVCEVATQQGWTGGTAGNVTTQSTAAYFLVPLLGGSVTTSWQLEHRTGQVCVCVLLTYVCIYFLDYDSTALVARKHGAVVCPRLRVCACHLGTT